MTDEKNRASLSSRYLVHLTKAFFLKLGVAHGENFIDHQNLRLQVRCDRKGQPDIHAAAVTLHRCIKKLFDLRECNDLIELLLDLRARHSKDRAVQKDIFAAG